MVDKKCDFQLYQTELKASMKIAGSGDTDREHDFMLRHGLAARRFILSSTNTLTH